MVRCAQHDTAGEDYEKVVVGISVHVFGGCAVLRVSLG
jgi:hypothetical protein